MTDRRVALTHSIMEILDSWGISSAQKIVLLGLPDDVRVRHLEQYRRERPFPDDSTVNTHLEHIVGIADALRTTYPRNIEMGALWLKQPHKRFQGNAPMSLMINNGLDGLINVRAHLDCSFAWNASGSK